MNSKFVTNNIYLTACYVHTKFIAAEKCRKKNINWLSDSYTLGEQESTHIKMVKRCAETQCYRKS